MSDIADHLRRVPLFAGMTDSAIDSIAGLANDPGDAFYVIMAGRVRVVPGGGAVRELGAGDFLGEIALVDGRPRTATVSAEGPVDALIVRRDGFARLVDEHPAVRYGILTALTDRIRRTPRAPGA